MKLDLDSVACNHGNRSHPSLSSDSSDDEMFWTQAANHVITDDIISEKDDITTEGVSDDEFIDRLLMTCDDPTDRTRTGETNKHCVPCSIQNPLHRKMDQCTNTQLTTSQDSIHGKKYSSQEIERKRELARQRLLARKRTIHTVPSATNKS